MFGGLRRKKESWRCAKVLQSRETSVGTGTWPLLLFITLKIHKGNVDFENRLSWSCWHMRNKCVRMLFLFKLGVPEARLSEQSLHQVASWFMDFSTEKTSQQQPHKFCENCTHRVDKGRATDWWFHVNLHNSALCSRKFNKPSSN